jgi:hypothetical protein
LKKPAPAKNKKSKAKEFTVPTGSSKPGIFDCILLVSFIAFISVLTTFKIFLDDDTFWHLATGRFIVQNGYVPSVDVFGFVTSGSIWIPFEWGWDVITYFIYNLGGFYSLSILRTLLVIALFSIILYVLWKNNISLSICIIFSVLLGFGLLGRFSLRPQIISYLFYVILVFILYRFKYTNRVKKSFVWSLPLIFLLWANMHMGVLLGLLVFGLFIISEETEYFFLTKKSKTEEEKGKNKYLLYAFVLSVISLLVNPHFIETYFYAFRHSQMQMLESINEWKSPFSSVSYYYVNIYLFFLFSGVIIFYYSFRKKEIFPALLYVVIGLYSVQSLRFISDFMVIIFIYWMLAAGLLFEKINLNNLLNKPAAKIILTVCLIFLTVKAYDDTLYKDYLGNYFRETGMEVNEKFFPKAMIDFIGKENIDKIGSKPFNNLKIGGYFIWNFPQSKNFIDSRNLNDSIYTMYKNIDLRRPGHEQMIENLGVDYVIYSTPYLTINPIEIRQNIISYLTAANDKWKLVYWDDRSFLFVKNIPAFENIIKKYEYKYVSPYNIIYNKTYLTNSFMTSRQEVTDEIIRKLNEEPQGVLINQTAMTFRISR